MLHGLTSMLHVLTSVCYNCMLLAHFLQTNVYASAQKRKISHFEGFKRKAVVVIPPHHELRRRAALRAKEMGKTLPDEAVNAMKGEGQQFQDCCWCVHLEGKGGQLWPCLGQRLGFCLFDLAVMATRSVSILLKLASGGLFALPPPPLDRVVCFPGC